MGRIDVNQNKIRGFRIELGEIESELKKIVSIAQTEIVVVSGEDEDYHKKLAAYLVL